MSTEVTIDEQSGDEPIVLAIDGHEAPMTRQQAITLGEALIEVARNVVPMDMRDRVTKL